MLDIKSVREQFKSLELKINDHPLVYLDSAATTLKPQRVVKRIEKFYAEEASNVHRGAHYLSDQATKSFEKSRDNIRAFINADSVDEIVFTKGTTESINLVASSYGDTFIKEGDEIIITELEHHANLVPWQNLALKKNAKLKYIKVLSDGSLDESDIDKLITEKTKIVAV
ncbi:MAG: aminotransferase class V-fold PLP-dependent enzyme, partial [Pseudobdellovibrio sp.]